ncbi:hypothetical protein HZC09_01795 [Candidatus Micrarchaeota archaeon]|nr:hypothetical protein [Candidatus Micrarchaeota archaeon]
MKNLVADYNSKPRDRGDVITAGEPLRESLRSFGEFRSTLEGSTHFSVVFQSRKKRLLSDIKSLFQPFRIP